MLIKSGTKIETNHSPFGNVGFKLSSFELEYKKIGT